MIAHLPVGDPLDPTTYIGPLINAAARDRVQGMIDKAVEDGAGRLVYGGERIDVRRLLRRPRPSSRTSTTAATSPSRRSSARSWPSPRSTPRTQAVALANDSEYGLSAYIQSRDIARVNRLVPRLKAGTVYVNPGPNPITSPATPFGGVGMSGFGREGGKAGLDEFINVKGVGIGRV